MIFFLARDITADVLNIVFSSFLDSKLINMHRCTNDCPFKKGGIRTLHITVRFDDIPFYMWSGYRTEMYFYVIEDRDNSLVRDPLVCAKIPVRVWKRN